jgi:PAS domain-containing protein
VGGRLWGPQPAKNHTEQAGAGGSACTPQAPVARVSLTAAGRQALYGAAGSDFRHPDGERHACCRASRRAHHPSMQLVPDTRADARFERCACVAGPPHVRFFAAAPLVSSEGHVLGNLGVMDTRPRSFPAGTLNIICSFAELAVRELERDRDVPPEPRSALPALPLDAQQRAVRALSSSREAVLLLDLSRPTWPIQYVNERWCASTGLTEQDCLRTGLWQVLDVAEDQEALELAAGSLRARAPFALTIAGPAGRQLTLELRPATADHLSAAMPPVGIPNLMESSGEATGGAGPRPAAAQWQEQGSLAASWRPASPAACSACCLPRLGWSDAGRSSASPTLCPSNPNTPRREWRGRRPEQPLLWRALL